MRRTSDMVMPTPELANLASRLLHELRPGIDKYALLDRATGESYDLPPIFRRIRTICHRCDSRDVNTGYGIRNRNEDTEWARSSVRRASSVDVRSGAESVAT